MHGPTTEMPFHPDRTTSMEFQTASCHVCCSNSTVSANIRHVPPSVPIITTPPVTFAPNTNNVEHQKQHCVFDSYSSDAAYFCFIEKKEPCFEFSYNIPLEHTAVDFNRDYDPNQLLKWCLWT